MGDMRHEELIYWRNHASVGVFGGVCMLVVAYLGFIIGAVQNSPFLQLFLALPAVIASPLQRLCMNQPDDCGFGMLFLSIVVGWPVMGLIVGMIVGLIRKKRHHV